ncbi:MAG: P-II family nitrogen regulator [Nitrosopumilaceae archaeon]
MKRIDAIISPKMLEPVIKALRKVGVGGFSVMDAEGQGSAEPPLVGEFFDRKIVMVVVDDDKADDIMEEIAKTACTGTKGDGKIFISNVEESTDICSKEKGIHTL